MSLEIKNLKKSFQQGGAQIQILKGLNASIAEGEMVAVVGRSGSGKSTLLSLLAGLEKPEEGEIKIHLHNMTNMSEAQLTRFRAENLGFVFQQYHLISHLTALENVMLPLEILKKERAQELSEKLLTELGLGHRLSHFPHQLSGGECQRVAIARALITEPKVLLADEPSGNLDSETGDTVMELFFELVKRKNITTILVTHSETLANKCQRKLRLQNGLLTESVT
jgi:putative ABC transport system ATP-binding protein